MTALKKQRIVSVLKYTWPFYIVSAVLVVVLLGVLFGIAHPVPDYKTLTLFVTGEAVNPAKLREDLLSEFKEKELKTVSCISSKPDSGDFNHKLTIAGYASADVFILTETKLNSITVSDFALELEDELLNLYQGYSVFAKDDVKYGIKLNKEVVKEYFSLPEEDCYLVFNGKSVNTGKYSTTSITEHDNALTLVKNWGI